MVQTEVGLPLVSLCSHNRGITGKEGRKRRAPTEQQGLEVQIGPRGPPASIEHCRLTLGLYSRADYRWWCHSMASTRSRRRRHNQTFPPHCRRRSQCRRQHLPPAAIKGVEVNTTLQISGKPPSLPLKASRWSGQVRSGQVRSGQVRSGQVRSGQVRSGHITSQHTTLTCTLSACAMSSSLKKASTPGYTHRRGHDRSQPAGNAPPLLISVSSMSLTILSMGPEANHDTVSFTDLINLRHDSAQVTSDK